MARSPQQDLLLVILMMAGLGIAWYYMGGTANDLARSGPLFQTPKIGDTLPVFQVPGVTLPNAPEREEPEPPRTETITNYLGTFTEKKSPHAAYVSLERGNAASGLASEYVTVRVSSSAPQKVTLSGWRIESTVTNLGATIPLAAELPFQGSVNNTGPVALSRGQVAYLVTGRSPNGTSFRTNLCTGYFEQFQNFSPSLKLECPTPQTEAEALIPTGAYSEECFDFVRTLPRCTLVLQSVPLDAGATCSTFVTTHLSYNGCIQAHKNDPKFYKDTWYLFLGRGDELWRSRSERIRLVDETGAVVDSVSY